ncbi:MAG: sulfate ABC transporter ATP-binding protein [Zoogloeaceae bacterium]|jgi:sulfate transport system ATP-binding protein|nr:sulfate ABC transporter ATP-binding protein [Zoogloeaceae bacterium]
MGIAIQNLSKRFGNFSALSDVSLSLREGELTALLGPSGSGKTTLLRIIAGLEFPDSGSLRLFGEEAKDRPAKDRNIGFVFQHYALFRHMTIFDNVAFGLSVRPKKSRPNKAAIHQKVMHLLDMVQLAGFAKRFPAELSGGQKQRVALARALALEPKFLLLDEPFGALDAKVRQELRRWLRQLHDETKLTSVFVTHDQEEALEVADRIVIFNQGKIEQVGTPEEVYDHPANPFVYQFIGHVNRYCGNADNGTEIYVRPHDVVLHRENFGGDGIAVCVQEHKTLGNRVRVALSFLHDGERIEADLDKKQWRALALQKGDAAFCTIADAKVYNPDDTWSDYVI